MNKRKIKGYVRDIEDLINKIDAKQAEINKLDAEFENELNDTRNVLSPFMSHKDVEEKLDEMKKQHEEQKNKLQKSVDKMEKTAEKKKKKVFKPVDRIENKIKMLNKMKENLEKEIQKVEEEIKRLESEIAKAEGKEKEKLEKQLSGLNKKRSTLTKKLKDIIKQLGIYAVKSVKTASNLKKVIASATNPDKYIKEADKKEQEKQAKPEVKPKPEKKPEIEKKPEENYEPPVIPEVKIEDNNQEIISDTDEQRKEKIANEISENVGKKLSEEQLEEAKKAKEEQQRKEDIANEIAENVQKQQEIEDEKRKRDKKVDEILEEIERNKKTKEEIEKSMADELKKQQAEHTATVDLNNFDIPDEIVINPDDISKNSKDESGEKQNLPDVQKSKFRIALETAGNSIKKFFNRIRTGAKNMGASMKQAMIEILKDAQDKLEDEEPQKPDWYEEKTVQNGGIKMPDDFKAVNKNEIYRGSVRESEEVRQAVEEVAKKLDGQTNSYRNVLNEKTGGRE